eukprot:3604198-Prymnesium_polylepis.1
MKGRVSDTYQYAVGFRSIRQTENCCGQTALCGAWFCVRSTHRVRKRRTEQAPYPPNKLCTCLAEESRSRAAKENRFCKRPRYHGGDLNVSMSISQRGRLA